MPKIVFATITMETAIVVQVQFVHVTVIMAIVVINQAHNRVLKTTMVEL